MTADNEVRVTFRWMLKDWKEVTDPTKHLFEDVSPPPPTTFPSRLLIVAGMARDGLRGGQVAIASWLIVVWRKMYADSDGKPPGGFVDVGCGNGLLQVGPSQHPLLTN